MTLKPLALQRHGLQRPHHHCTIGRRSGPGRRPSQATRPAAATAAPALVYEDLVGYLRAGCKPRDRWLIGTEHEKLGFDLKDHSRMSYDQIKVILTTLAEEHGWNPMIEEGKIIGVLKDGQSVTLEPGGQFELSGAPLRTLHDTLTEVSSHLDEVTAIADTLGCGFSGVGLDPKWAPPNIPIMPKDRYQIMRAYMPTVGSMGLDMMLRSCTIQVNLDFESEPDMIEKFRIGLALQPVATALFANSPLREGAPNGYMSYRSHVWTDVDNQRCGTLPFVFDDDFGFERYVDYMLDVPMYFIYRDGQYINATGHSFRRFMEGEHPALPGERPNLDDWENHLTTVFPEVRLKKYMEMRGGDGGSLESIIALPALWVGLLYDPEAQAAAAALVSDWTMAEMDMLRAEVPRTALRTPFRDGTLQDVALEVVRICRGGLERRGLGEEVFIKSLEETAATGACPAERVLELYNGEWAENVERMFDHCKY